MATLSPINTVTGRAVPVPGDDVDTDQIIPARFMKCVTFDGLGSYAFYDVRFQEDGSKKPHRLNEDRYAGASIFLVGSNFGCGSSREHAPQSLHKFGVRAIVGQSFAEIFFGNATTLGIPCVTPSYEDQQKLEALVEEHPETEVSVDVENLEVRAGDLTIPVTIAPSAREALIHAQWDPIALMLDKPEEIDETARALGYV